MNGLLLISCSDPATRERVRGDALDKGLAVRTAGDLAQVRELLAELPVDVVAVERRELDEAGELVAQVSGLAPGLVALDPEELFDERLELALRMRRLERENRRLVARALDERPATFVGRSRSLHRLKEVVQRVASTPRTTVLVTGEAGVGKETVAREIHAVSARGEGPFLALRCAELDASAIADALFEAEGGTLFLDEVGALPAEAQLELAAFLQERQLRRGPNEREAPIDVRIVAATCRDITDRRTGAPMREDLVYRLNVLSIEVPPLRERGDDLPDMLQHELARMPEGCGGWRISEQAWKQLLEARWRGNLRELRTTLEQARLAALQAGTRTIELDHLSPQRSEEPVVDTLGRDADVLPLGDRSLRTVEEALVRRVLDEAHGNRSRAARVLGVNRTTLYNKLKQYGIASA